MTHGPVGVAVVGAGVISAHYLRNLTDFADVRVLGVADLDAGRATAVAREYGVPVAGDLATVLALPEVEVVVNLTVPAAHVEVATAALRAGKHVYGEKPLALDPQAGQKLLLDAEQAGLRVGSAPDTFLGAGLQSALRAIASGAIGTPVAASTTVQGPGPEAWHPGPEFLYQVGAGPLFDLGPYYLTALVTLLGPVSRVAATARRARARRTVGSGPRAGTSFAVEVPTHVTALLEFASGPAGDSTFSFDSPVGRKSIEITGTEATLSVPDPNTFDGPLLIRGRGDEEWRDLPVSGTTAGRGLGVLDLARALRAGLPHRASGALAQHVLSVMAAVIESAETAEFRELDGDLAGTGPLPADWDPYTPTLG